MELKKGKFKKTDFIEIETQKELWQNINPDKLEHEFIITGIVTVEDMKRRLRICVHNVSKKEIENKIEIEMFESKNPFDFAIKESCIFVRKEILKHCWLIIGHLFESDKFIAITYFEKIDIYVYYFYNKEEISIIST